MFKDLFTEGIKRIDNIIDPADVALFADSLMMYTMYNDKDSIEDLMNIKNIQNLFIKPKKVYRLVRGSSDKDYIINKHGLTSASTKLSPKMIEDMKDMIHQYKKQGDYYLQEIEQAQGIDIMKLFGIFKGDQRRLRSLYDQPGNEPVSSLYDSFKQLKDQKEFIIFGDYKVTKITKV